MGVQVALGVFRSAHDGLGSGSAGRGPGTGTAGMLAGPRSAVCGVAERKGTNRCRDGEQAPFLASGRRGPCDRVAGQGIIVQLVPQRASHRGTRMTRRVVFRRPCMPELRSWVSAVWWCQGAADAESVLLAGRAHLVLPLDGGWHAGALHGPASRPRLVEPVPGQSAVGVVFRRAAALLLIAFLSPGEPGQCHRGLCRAAGPGRHPGSRPVPSAKHRVVLSRKDGALVTAPDVRLAASAAAELARMLTFLGDCTSSYPPRFAPPSRPRGQAGRAQPPHRPARR